MSQSSTAFRKKIDSQVQKFGILAYSELCRPRKLDDSVLIVYLCGIGRKGRQLSLIYYPKNRLS